MGQLKEKRCKCMLKRAIEKTTRILTGFARTETNRICLFVKGREGVPMSYH